MFKRRLSRRNFLARTAQGAAVLGASAAVGPRALGAGERLSIGIIGCGGRGSALMAEIQKLAKAHGAEITAVCDVWKVNLARAADTVKGWFQVEPRRFTRFGDLLALEDIQAVVIATPDFGHTPILIEALKAGKDAYVEKPMSLEISKANEAFDLARERNRIVQVGTQKRSEGGYRAAAKEIAAGAVGRIVRVSTAVHFNEPRWARAFGDCKESDVDWEAYLFNRPKQPFDPRLLRRWHLYRQFTNGLSGLWMSHYADAVHLLTGAKYPSSAVAHGGIYAWKDGREHTDTFHALFDYPEGFFFGWAMSLTNSQGGHFTVHGRDGTLTAESWTVSGAGGRAPEKVEARKIELEPNQSHMGNWLECLRSRNVPNADIEYGHQHSVATILAALALESGRRHKYDRDKKEALEG